ncbi:MAG TPA: CHAT domain-containing protein [Candidatus Angelobacter sp.]|jgi:CHAT domain-containing protein|nr:CHAT domain-containing protein [Candidatus Angelobacter sp.]
MRRYNLSICVIAVLCSLPSAFGNQIGTPGLSGVLQPGVVVEQVIPSLSGDRAGLHRGDVILRWSRGNSKGNIESPFDLFSIEIEQAPRGPVTLYGNRGTQKASWRLGEAGLGVRVRPNLPESILSTYQEGQESAEAGKLTMAIKQWHALAGQIKNSYPSFIRVWLLYQSAELLGANQEWKQADESYSEALEQAVNVGPNIKEQLLRSWARTFQQRSDWDTAEKYYQQALAEGRKVGREGLITAANLRGLGSVATQRGDLANAGAYYQQARAISERSAPFSLAVADSIKGLGDVSEKRRALAVAEKFYHQALAISQHRYPESPEVADSLYGLSRTALDRGNTSEKIKQYILGALAIRQKLNPKSLETAISLNILGDYRLRTDLAHAEECYRQALAIAEKLAPESLTVAFSLSGLGAFMELSGDHAQAMAYHQRALAIRERLSPSSFAVVTSLLWIGSAAFSTESESSKTNAEQYWLRALAVGEKLNPQSLEVASICERLGDLAYANYDLAKAEHYLMQAVAISDNLGPNVQGTPVRTAESLMTLGRVFRIRGDTIGAERFQQRALAIWQRLAPNGRSAAYSLFELGGLALDRGEVAIADQYLHQALAIWEKVAPDSLFVAAALGVLGDVAAIRHNSLQAERYYREELEIEKRLAPGKEDEAATLHSLAEVLEQRGELDSAEDYYTQALAIRAKVVPGSVYHAETLASLAGIMRRKNQFEKATQLYEQALTALDIQAAHLGGGDEARAGFRSRHAGYATGYIDLLLDHQQAELALRVLERSRARNLLEMLAHAHVDIHQGVDSDLIARERAIRRSLAARSNDRLQLVNGNHAEAQLAVINREIENLLEQQRQIKEQMRASGPGYAALTNPFSLSATEIQQLLDPQTLLLEYSLGQERSYVFAVTAGSVTSYELANKAVIERQARQVYEIITARNRFVQGEDEQRTQARLAKADAEYSVVAAELSRLVLGPVAKQIAQTKRLLIINDGLLAYIPFSALPVPQDAPTRTKLPVPLILEHEIVALPSASVLGLLRKLNLGRSPAPKGIAVLADPVFTKDDVRVAARRPGESVSDAKAWVSSGRLTRALTDVNGRPQLNRLLFTRQEATAIMSIASTKDNLQALDFQASRQTATSASLAQYRIVHFATHGLLDSKHPELSGLVLSLIDSQGRTQNGFLDLEDIYNLNLAADLVVLSACETGLGKEVSGEGLIGLTRGFMYAGASRVVASLWKVSDLATTELMKRFYRSMELERQSPAAALRTAQIAMWKQNRWRAPYFWAAFQLHGEWK